MKIYCNREFVTNAQAQISVSDRGLLLGDGLFETLRCYNGQPFALKEHWQRLQAGLDFLKLPLPLSLERCSEIIKELLTINCLKQQDTSVRITITRGVGPRGILPPEKTQPSVIIQSALIDNISHAISVTLSSITINERSPLSRFKTLNYLEHICARQQAGDKGYDDAILLNTIGNVVCSTAANIFIVKNKKIYTPTLMCGALPGVTRARIFEIAKGLNIIINEVSMAPEDLMRADEVFITNSLIEIIPIYKIDNVEFDITKDKTITQALIKGYKDATTAIPC